MKKLLLTTSVFVSFAMGANAEGLTFTADSSVGSTFTATGIASQASLLVEGFGTGGVVVSNSGLNISITPDADADAELFGYADGDSDGEINVENERSVAVSGVLSGMGRVIGSGETETTFDAALLAEGAGSAEFDETDDTDIADEIGAFNLSGSGAGMLRLAGVSGSSAGMQMTGNTSTFIGRIGTEVGGSFDADASFDTDNGGGDEGPEFGGIYSEADSELSINVTPDDIDLAISNLGGGTMLLVGANSDVFTGAAEANSEAALEIEDLCSFFGDCTTPTDPAP